MTIPENKTRIIITITKELLRLIDELAEKTGRTRSQVIQENLDYLWNEQIEAEYYKSLEEKE